MKNAPLQIGNITIQPGEQITVALPTPELYTCAPIYIPIHVIHGKKEGPTLLICGSMHGDEINGMAVIQRLGKIRKLSKLRGTLISIPTINVYGMMTLSRNLPDRRDLEGSFPGSETGSFAMRLAHYLHEKIFSLATHCIDLHTGEPHIYKLPQVKVVKNDHLSLEIATQFHAPVIVPAKRDEGLLFLSESIPTIVYEMGEALRLDERGIKIGVNGILRIMSHLDMLPKPSKPQKQYPIHTTSKQEWVRAPRSGLCEVFPKVGKLVKQGERIATVTDPFGTAQTEEVFAPFSGFLIGQHTLPILNEGEPIVQIGEIEGETHERIEQWSSFAEGFEND